MFGNPQISSTPVDDIYSTQADTYGNSFYNPVNPANMNSGWGIDPSLLTPSYTAQYRPGYSGSNGATEYNRAGFFSSLNQLTPWTQTPMWGNPAIHQQDSVDSVASRPVDAGMWAAQRVAMPVAAFWGAGKLMGGYNSFGMAKGATAAGRSFGRGVGGGLARGMGIGNIGGGIAARGMAGAMGGIGAVAGGYALPLLAVQGVAELAERAVFNPYINTRRSAEELRTNFNGVTFGDSAGNSITGGGLGNRESTDIAADITSQGIHDMNLGTSEYAEAASMVSRAGLMDNVNSKDIAKRVKDSIDQVKLIMSVASMPELRDAIEQLAKFQKMGANVSGGIFSDAAGTMRQMGTLASVAGTNVQKLMNTVGAQGQYLYQANGMTPHLGQLAAANSFAALSAGNRMGLISSAQLARMGGLEGATQASLTGQINASQTLYNKLSNYNTYMGRGTNNSMLGNLAQFGQTMAADPMGTYGGMILNGRQMAGRQLQEKGSLAAEDQVWQMMKDQPGMVDRKTGKVTIERATPFLMQQGWTEDQIQAFAAQRISETDKGSYDLSIKAMNKSLREQQMQYVEQNTLYAGIMGRTARGAMQLGRNLTDRVSQGVAQPVAGIVGDAGDTTNQLWYKAWFGDTIKSKNLTIEDALLGKGSSTENIHGFDISKISSLYSKSKELTPSANVMGYKTSPEYGITVSPNSPEYKSFKNSTNQLEGLMEKSDPDAIQFIKAINPADKLKALDKLKSSSKLDAESISYLSNPINVKKVDAELSIKGNGSKDTPETKLFKGSTQKLTELKNTLDPDALNFLKAKTPEEKTSSLQRLQSSNKLDSNTVTYLSNPINLRKVELELNTQVKSQSEAIDTKNLKTSTGKIKDLKDKLDPDVIHFLKETNPVEKQKVLEVLKSKNKLDSESVTYLSNPLNVKKMELELAGKGTKSETANDDKSLKASTEKIKDLKDKLDPDTLTFLKADTLDSRKKALDVLQAKNKVDKTTAEFLSSGYNFEKVEKALLTPNTSAKLTGFNVDKIANSPESRETKFRVTELATRINELKDIGDSNAITYLKDPSSKEGKEALNKLITQKKFSIDTQEYLRSPDNYKAAVAELQKVPKTTEADKDKFTFSKLMSNVFRDITGGMFIPKAKPEKVENFRETLAKVGGLDKQDIGVNLRAAGLSLEAASRIVDGEMLAPNNIEKRLESDKSLQQISKITGINDPQKLMAYIDKTSGSVADNKLVRLSMGALNVDPRLKGDAFVKAASEKVGGGVFDEAAIETKHLDQPDKLKATAAVQEDTRMRMDLNNKLRAGHIDFSGYQATMNAIDTKASTKQFAEAVDKFEKIVEGNGGSTQKRSWSDMFFGKKPEGSDKLPGLGNGKDMQKASGN